MFKLASFCCCISRYHQLFKNVLTWIFRKWLTLWRKSKTVILLLFFQAKHLFCIRWLKWAITYFCFWLMTELYPCLIFLCKMYKQIIINDSDIYLNKNDSIPFFFFYMHRRFHLMLMNKSEHNQWFYVLITMKLNGDDFSLGQIIALHESWIIWETLQAADPVSFLPCKNRQWW